MNQTFDDLHTFQTEFLKAIEERVSTQSYNTWFSPLKINELSNDSLLISVPQAYYSSWIEEKGS